MKKFTLNIFFLLASPFLFSQAQFPVSGSMNKYTVFDFSQYWLGTADTQVFHNEPDMNIRAWGKWDRDGIAPGNYNFNIVSQYHNRNIGFIGSTTATVYFYDEAADSAQFKDMVTRDASNNLVPHNNIVPGAYRGNIANPAYRQYVIGIAKIQIDGGVDGIFFDEVLGGYDGATYNGNEGFDDYHLKDFNKFLSAKYPGYTQSDWMNKFGMTADNYIDNTKALDDLTNNFNYRKYLQTNGWQSNPLTASNPLAAEWGHIINNRADTMSNTFLAKYTTMYWRDIVTQTRQYARTTYGKEVLITSNGLFPYVDFNCLGMYNYNQDNNGSEANYVPISAGHLNGSFSLQSVFKSLYQKSQALSGAAPVVLFIDWPTQMMTDYNNLPLSEKEDYWRIYAAEAYANGLFLAFHLRTSIASDPTAASQGILDFLKNYSNFYKEDSSFYHNNQILSKTINVSASGVNSSLMLQTNYDRYTIHLVNHNYISTIGMTQKNNFTVALTLDSIPKSVYVKSPDFSGYRLLNSTCSNGTLTVTVDNLNYYDVIVLDYKNELTGVIPDLNNSLDLKIFPNPSHGSFTILPVATGQYKEERIFIYNEFGRPVVSKILFDEPLQMELEPGVYQIKCNNTIKKLVIF